MNDHEPATPPERDDAAPANVRQVQGALGSSQGDAGARDAASVLQPSAEHPGTPDDATAADWASDKPIERQVGQGGEATTPRPPGGEPSGDTNGAA